MRMHLYVMLVSLPPIHLLMTWRLVLPTGLSTMGLTHAGRSIHPIMDLMRNLVFILSMQMITPMSLRMPVPGLLRLQFRSMAIYALHMHLNLKPISHHPDPIILMAVSWNTAQMLAPPGWMQAH